MTYPSKEYKEAIKRAILAELQSKPGGTANWRDVAQALAQRFNLSPEEINEPRPKGMYPETVWLLLCRRSGYQLMTEGEITRAGGVWTLTKRPSQAVRFLLLQGPNLNLLGKREPHIYGTLTMTELHARLEARARELGVELLPFQANGEGAIIDFLQAQAPGAQGIIINPGALTHYGLSLRDALVATGLPVVEVHLSNIYAREEWRHDSVIAPIARGQVSGLGWRSYLAALEYLAAEAKER